MCRFTDFMLEGSGVCEYDSVTVYDGPNRSSRVMAKLCGRQLPDVQRSTGSQMTVRFKTDGSVAYKGFHAQYWETYGNRLIALKLQYFCNDDAHTCV